MLNRSPRWLTAQNQITSEERQEIARAEPIHYRAVIRRMDRWGDGWQCQIYDFDAKVAGESVMARGPMAAFREALRQSVSYAEYEGCQVEVVDA